MTFAGFRAFNCATCCVGCLIGQDLFEGEESSTPSESGDGELSQWTTTGTVDVGDGKLRMTAVASAIFTPAPATVDDGVYVLLTGADVLTETGTLHVVVARLDENNYLFGEVAVAADEITLRVGQVVGGSLEYLIDPVTIELEESSQSAEASSSGDSFNVAVCWFPGEENEPVDLDVFLFATTADGSGTISWTNPENVFDSDGSVAQYEPTSTSGITSLTTGGYNFLGLIPHGSTIRGVTAGCELRYVQLGSGDAPVIELSMTLGNTLSGNSETKGTVLVTSAFVATGFGGEADTWDDLLTVEAMLQGQVGLDLLFSQSAGAPARLEVDWVGLTIWFTTPEKQRGKLQITFENSSSVVRHATLFGGSFDPDAIGKGTGLIATAGVWGLASYRLEYIESTARPDCPDCVDPGECGCTLCNEDAQPPREIAVSDFAGATLVAGCDDCDQITGTYITECRSDCLWVYLEEICQEVSLPFGGRAFFDITLVIGLDDNGDLRWAASVSLYTYSCGVTSCSAIGFQATYLSDVIEPDECATFPVTLTRQSQRFFAGFTGEGIETSPCGDGDDGISFPDTLTLDTP